MSKLTSDNKFLDFSDYGRPFAKYFTPKLVNTAITPIHITLIFGICGIVSIVLLFQQHVVLAGLFLVLKSIIDAMDGELARLKKKPSHVGRYLDSVFDNLLNLALFISFAILVKTSIWWGILAYACVQLQGTFFNFYYVIIRTNSSGGDKTSQIFETQAPKAFPFEKQRHVNFLFYTYLLLYGVFDKIVYTIDSSAQNTQKFPNWFMSLVSMYGLGFQLLIMSFFIAFEKTHWIIPFFIGYSLLAFVLVLARKFMIEKHELSENT